MGVTGLWKLIEASGKPVPLETLENKILAIGRRCVSLLPVLRTTGPLTAPRYLHMAASGHQGLPGLEGRHLAKRPFARFIPPVVQIVVLQNSPDFRFRRRSPGTQEANDGT